MGHVPVSGDFVRCIDNYNPFPGLIRKNPGYFTQHGGLTHTGTTQQQDALTRLHQVFYHFYSAVYGPTDTASDSDYLPFSIANGGNAVKGFFYSGSIILAKIAYSSDQAFQLFASHGIIRQRQISG